jgi:type VI secretion system protein ImpE
LTMTLAAQQLFDAGQLRDAIQVMNDEVKRHPADVERRGLLMEFLCLAGDLERADLQLDVIAKQDAAAAVAVAQLRQVVRAEVARRDWFTAGRLPDLLGPPPPDMKRRLEAVILLRDNDPGGAARLLAEAEEQRPPVSGTCDGTAFGDLRDADDLTAGVFEVLTSTGKYFWIPAGNMVSIEFQPIKRPRDLLWRRAHVMVRSGPEGEVFLPALYPTRSEDGGDTYLLGRATDWTGGESMPVRGIGQRVLLIGEDVLPFLEIGRIDFNAAAA